MTMMKIKFGCELLRSKLYDTVTGADVTSKFDIANTGGVITATLKSWLH